MFIKFSSKKMKHLVLSMIWFNSLPKFINYYNTRYATNQNLYRPPSRSNYGLARFRVVASQIWEASPTGQSVLIII